jgi:hypothetical protein
MIHNFILITKIKFNNNIITRLSDLLVMAPCWFIIIIVSKTCGFIPRRLIDPLLRRNSKYYLMSDPLALAIAWPY